MSLFSTVTDPNPTANQINNDSHKINICACQCKIDINSDTSKQAQEVKISCRIKVIAHPQVVFSNNLVHET